MLRWPSNLPPQDVAVDLVPRAIMGPPSMSGSQQAVQSDAGCWYIQYQGISVIQSFRIKLWRVMAALLNVVGTPILVPVFDCKQTPWPLDASGHRVFRYDAVPHSDGAFFSDGSGYATRVVDIASDAFAAAGATSIDILVTNAGELTGGEFFSTDDGHLYVITTVETLVSSSDTYRIGVAPPLRNAISAGAHLEFENPVCRCVLDNPNSMSLMLTQRIVGRPSLTFVEDFS